MSSQRIEIGKSVMCNGDFRYGATLVEAFGTGTQTLPIEEKTEEEALRSAREFLELSDEAKLEVCAWYWPESYIVLD